MDPVRNLGRIEPWQESLERSRARRDRSRRASRTRRQRDPERRLAQTAIARRTGTDRPRAARRKRKRSRTLVVRAGGTLALALTGAVLLGLLAGRGSRAPVGAARAAAVSAPVRSTDGGPLAPRGVASQAGAPTGSQRCQPVSSSSGYVNPLAGARVTPERIDQGVDYAGSGTLDAIGAAIVTHVATPGTGWPGSFIEYRMLDGPDAGCYVYYAEGVIPVAHLHVGELVPGGKPIATIIRGWSTGIELGWGAGRSTVTYAAKTHQWSANDDQDSIATAAGKSFSALIASLGGPPGKVEG